MPHAYASQFRAMVVEQVRSGMRVVDVAASVDVAEATVYRWVRQDRVDRGELKGTSTSETAELRAARRRIAELESELATVRRASEARPLASLVESLIRAEPVAENDSFAADLELSDLWMVLACSCLEYEESSFHFGFGSKILEQDDVVGEVRHSDLGELCDTKQFDAFVRHHQTDSAARESLRQGVHEFAEADVVR
jgi:transposase